MYKYNIIIMYQIFGTSLAHKKVNNAAMQFDIRKQYDTQNSYFNNH